MRMPRLNPIAYVLLADAAFWVAAIYTLTAMFRHHG
jgi:hypothetical protein